MSPFVTYFSSWLLSSPGRFLLQLIYIDAKKESDTIFLSKSPTRVGYQMGAEQTACVVLCLRSHFASCSGLARQDGSHLTWHQMSPSELAFIIREEK